MKQILQNILTHWVTLVAIAISGLANFFSWILTIAPESQTTLLQPLVDIMPITYRPQAAVALRALGIFTALMAAYRHATRTATK